MIRKSISPRSQSGATFLEILTGVVIFGLLFVISFVVIQQLREGKRVERTLSAIYTLKEDVKRTYQNQGNYTQERISPLLFSTKTFPDTLTINYEKKTVSTPMGHPLDVLGRGRHFSIDLYGLSQDDCREMGQYVIAGTFFALGNRQDDFVLLRIGRTDFDDNHPLTAKNLEKACTQSFSIDVIMAFR